MFASIGRHGEQCQQTLKKAAQAAGVTEQGTISVLVSEVLAVHLNAKCVLLSPF